MRFFRVWAMFVAGACSDGASVWTDAAVDTSLDAVDSPDASHFGCPVRTALVGEPEGPISLSEVRNGNYRLSSYLDIEALAGIRVITGTLTVEPRNFTELSLPDLEVIGGHFFVYDSEDGMLSSISMPALQTVRDSISITAPNLAMLDVSSLDSAGGDTNVSAGVADVRLPCLRVVGELRFATDGDIEFPLVESASMLRIMRSSLTALSLPATLTLREGVDVRDSPNLTTLVVPATTLGLISISNAPQLATVRFDNLTSVTSTPLGDGTVSLANIGAAALSFPQLTSVANALLVKDTALTSLDGFAALTSVGYVEIQRNPELAALGLGAVTSMTTIETNRITDNPMLPTCQATALRNRVARTFSISGNNDAATCP